MNRFAFPREWMIENWPQSAVLEADSARAARIVPQQLSSRIPLEGVIQIMLADAVVSVAPGIDGAILIDVLYQIPVIRTDVPNRAIRST